MTPRQKQLVERFPELKIDALIVSALPNVRYLTGFTGSNGIAVLWPGGAVLFTDPRYTIQGASEAKCKVKIVRGPLVPEALTLIAARGWRSIGFEEQRITYGMYAELQQRLPARASLAGVNGLVENLRMIKSEEEIEAIRASVRTNSRAFDRAVKRLKSSMTESELAAEIDFYMRKLGASATAFETIVASGARSALPHARPTHEALGANQLLLIDMGAMQAGYASDMTRMLHMGKPGTRAKKLYSAVLEAQLAAVAAVRPGVTCNGVDRAARRVLKSHGLEKQFVHSTGHGLGLEIHEAPRIGKKDRTPLEAGMAITIEPGAYIQGFGGVRIEDTVLVTRIGCEVLTPTPKELLVV